jgi:G protein beta subunit-like protein
MAMAAAAAGGLESAAAAGGPEPLLVAGGYGPDLQFLSALRGDLRRTLTLKDYGHVNRLAVCPPGSGRSLLAVVGNPNVRLYEVRGEESSASASEPVASFEGHRNNVTAVGWELTSRWFYTSSEDGTIRVWDSRSQKCQLCYENTGGLVGRTAVHSVDLHPNQVELVAGDDQGKVLVWDLTMNRARRTLIPEEGVPVRSVCTAPDAKVMISANHEGTCHVFGTLSDDSYDLLQKIDAHGAYILKCSFSPEAKHFATVSADNTTNIWRSHAEGFARCFSLTGHTKWVWDCAFTSDGQYLVTGSSDSTCRLWDVRSGSQRLEFSGFKKGVTAVALVDANERS